jgi:hypothetical protein
MQLGHVGNMLRLQLPHARPPPLRGAPAELPPPLPREMSRIARINTTAPPAITYIKTELDIAA